MVFKKLNKLIIPLTYSRRRPTTQSTAAKPTTTKASEPAEEGSSFKDADPKEIQAWIGVVTAVIGALGTLFAFANKYLDLPFGNK